MTNQVFLLRVPYKTTFEPTVQFKSSLTPQRIEERNESTGVDEHTPIPEKKLNYWDKRKSSRPIEKG